MDSSCWNFLSGAIKITKKNIMRHRKMRRKFSLALFRYIHRDSRSVLATISFVSLFRLNWMWKFKFFLLFLFKNKNAERWIFAVCMCGCGGILFIFTHKKRVAGCIAVKGVDMRRIKFFFGDIMQQMSDIRHSPTLNNFFSSF